MKIFLSMDLMSRNQRFSFAFYSLIASLYVDVRASIASLPNIHTYDVTFEHGFMFNLMRSTRYYVLQNIDKVNKAQTSFNARKIFSSISKESLNWEDHLAAIVTATWKLSFPVSTGMCKNNNMWNRVYQTIKTWKN